MYIRHSPHNIRDRCWANKSLPHRVEQPCESILRRPRRPSLPPPAGAAPGGRRLPRRLSPPPPAVAAPARRRRSRRPALPPFFFSLLSSFFCRRSVCSRYSASLALFVFVMVVALSGYNCVRFCCFPRCWPIPWECVHLVLLFCCSSYRFSHPYHSFLSLALS